VTCYDAAGFHGALTAMTDAGTDAIFDRLRRLAAEAGLPEIEIGTSYGTPALKVGGKAFVSVKNAETIVLSIPIEDKEPLIEMAPEIYYQTDHYRGWPSLPLRAAAIGDEELGRRLVEAWRFRAPRKLRAAFDGS
jgi:hypothetical protein